MVCGEDKGNGKEERERGRRDRLTDYRVCLDLLSLFTPTLTADDGKLIRLQETLFQHAMKSRYLLVARQQEKVLSC